MEQNESLTVLLIEPERYPKVVQIGSDLKSLQQAVGGWIEAVYPWEDKAAIILNEEGKINQLPLNRALRTEDGEIYDITAGNLFSPKGVLSSGHLASCRVALFFTMEDKKKWPLPG